MLPYDRTISNFMEWATPFLCLFWVRCGPAPTHALWLVLCWGGVGPLHCIRRSMMTSTPACCPTSPNQQARQPAFWPVTQPMKQPVCHPTYACTGCISGCTPARNASIAAYQPSVIGSTQVDGLSVCLQHGNHQWGHPQVGLGVCCCSGPVPSHGESSRFCSSSQLLAQPSCRPCAAVPV
jgi:hypothetical protein